MHSSERQVECSQVTEEDRRETLEGSEATVEESLEIEEDNQVTEEDNQVTEGDRRETLEGSEATAEESLGNVERKYHLRVAVVAGSLGLQVDKRLRLLDHIMVIVEHRRHRTLLAHNRTRTH